MEKEGKFKLKKNIFLPDSFLEKMDRISQWEQDRIHRSISTHYKDDEHRKKRLESMKKRYQMMKKKKEDEKQTK